jgi:uncharacterized protein YprB with RNaseH-like and TPR domain
MPKLVFDIETVGMEFDSLDEKSQEFLLAYSESAEEVENVKNGLGFSPLTGRVVAIGVLNPDTGKGAVYFDAGSKNLEVEEDSVAQYIPCSDEKEILKHFWELATHYNLFISFNGHAFDVPFLMIRSAILKIKPTVNLMHNRYAKQPHLDLLDVLSNFGAARWRKNLHMWCQAFGISSPKAEGVSGDDVAGLYKNAEYLKIAKYCFGDILATAKLYEYWDKYIGLR